MDELGRACLGIKVWYCPADGEGIVADIVAVHGFDANPYHTWVAKRSRLEESSKSQPKSENPDAKEDVIWLEKFLPTWIKTCKVLAFGYQCDFLKYAPKRNIANCAQELLEALSKYRTGDAERRRPIIFIGHSFGGIVVKEALVKATLADQLYGDIRRATHGIVFLGTPHNGSSVAAYGEMLVTITKAIGMGSDNQIIHSLREMSPELLRLATQFADIYDSFEVYCFYELLPWRRRSSTVIVDQNSAVIPGKPNDGLTTNHSGLNKYAEVTDPNLVKILNVIDSMVRSLQRKQMGAGGMFQDDPLAFAEPWAEAAQLAQSIDQLLDRGIQSLKANHADRGDTETLLSIKCQFQAFAYNVGLAVLWTVRRPLHHALTTSVADEVCILLKEMKDNLVTIDQHTSSVDTKASDTLQHAMQRLVGLFPVESDRSVFRDVLLSRVILPEESFQDLGQFSGVISPPHIEAAAAIKRIGKLMERSDAQRESSKKIKITIGKGLTLDMSKSSARTTGLLKHGQRPGQSSQVLVEWKYYTDAWSTEFGDQLFNRVELLCDFLRTASESSATLELRILQCLGYCHDTKGSRLGLVFSIPSSVDDRKSHLRLSELITAYTKNQRYPPAVGDRMRLASMLCKAIFEFHRAEWFHKAFTTYNVLLFAEGRPRDDGSRPPLEEYSLLAPYIVGFDSSRPSGPKTFSEPPTSSNDLWKYQHPAYLKNPMQKYRHEFDYYSLGVVLLEIGQWTPLSVMVPKTKDQCPSDFSQEIREQRTKELGSFMGMIYQNVIASLLGAFGDDVSDVERNEQMPIGQLVEFQAGITESLESCNA